MTIKIIAYQSALVTLHIQYVNNICKPSILRLSNGQLIWPQEECNND